MNKKSNSPTRLFSALLAIVFLVATAHAALSEKLRVVSCDLAGTPESAIANELKALFDKADPDIVFLQGVADWEASDRISKLRPGLRVLTCSLFPGAASQVAILARDKAVLSWVEPIKGGDGFALAVVQAGARKIAVFSVQSRDAAAASDRILAEVRKIQQFANNRPESFLIAGSPLTAATLSQGGFEMVPSDNPQKASTLPADLWTSNAGFMSRPRAITIAGLARPVLVSDVDTANAFATKFAYQNALLFPGESPAPIQAILQVAPAPQKQFPTGFVAAGIIGTVLLIALLIPRRSNSMALVPLNETNLPSTDPALNDPVRQGLLVWFKTMLMQRLIADRRKMIADENDATRRTLAIEQKLGELQVSLQDRISAYEGRIARLESELTAATFENRELIRHQINDLKEKVAKAKEEFVFDRN